MINSIPYWKIMTKIHTEDKTASLPRAIFGSWDLAMPLEHVGGSILVLDRFCNKSERMVTSPILSLLFEPIDDKLVNLFFFHLL